MKKGYIQIPRQRFEEPFWQEKKEFDRFDALLDLMRRANYVPGRIVVNNRYVDLQAGELAASLRFLASQWGWSVNRVRNYLDLLRSDTTIDTRTEQGITVIKLRDYCVFNNVKTGHPHTNEHTNEHANEHTDEHSSDTPRIQVEYTPDTKLNKEKKEKKEKNITNSNELEAPSEKEKIKKSSLKILDEENTRKKLREEFPQIDVDEEIAKMKDWLLANGKIKKDYPAYARNWLRRRRENLEKDQTTLHDQFGRSSRSAKSKNQENDNTEKIDNTLIETIRRAKAILDAQRNGRLYDDETGWKSDGW